MPIELFLKSRLDIRPGGFSFDIFLPIKFIGKIERQRAGFCKIGILGRGIDTVPIAVRIPVMAKTIQDEFLYKKVYEFSYAASRIASSAKNRDISELMESKAVRLLDSVLVADYGKTRELINSIISLSSLMVDSGMLNSINRDVLERESESIDLAIRALPKERERESLPDLNLGKIFSKSVLPIKRQIADKQVRQPVQSETEQPQSEIADKVIADETADRSNEEGGSFKSELRQSAIIAKLQRVENCRLNELQELFPHISERTLRYDLEYLISSGFIERIGSRRNSVYQLKSKNSPVIELPSHSANSQGF